MRMGGIEMRWFFGRLRLFAKRRGFMRGWGGGGGCVGGGLLRGGRVVEGGEGAGEGLDWVGWVCRSGGKGSP